MKNSNDLGYSLYIMFTDNKAIKGPKVVVTTKLESVGISRQNKFHFPS